MLGPWRILDAGSGTGHHLARIATVLSPPAIGLGVDISKLNTVGDLQGGMEEAESLLGLKVVSLKEAALRTAAT